MKIKKHLPNSITLLNLLSGCIALVFISTNQYEIAFFFVCLGIFFDFFDGFFARKFNVSGALGLQLDSLADMVTSGVVPGFMMYKLLYINQSKTIGYLSEDYRATVLNSPEDIYSILPYFGFIITLGACYRLANFNIDSRQTDSFIGLPTPANALFIMSLPLIVINTNIDFIIDSLSNTWVLLSISILSAYIMNAEVPLFSLKIKNFSFLKYRLQIFFLITSIIIIILFKYLSIPMVIISYIIISIINNISKK